MESDMVLLAVDSVLGFVLVAGGLHIAQALMGVEVVVCHVDDTAGQIGAMVAGAFQKIKSLIKLIIFVMNYFQNNL